MLPSRREALTCLQTNEPCRAVYSSSKSSVKTSSRRLGIETFISAA